MSRNSEMKQDLLTYLPPELTVDILSRLPVRSIIRCRCVCKSWLDSIKSIEFVNSHLSKSVPGLALFQRYFNLDSKPYKFVEFVENSMHPVFNMSFPHDYQQIHSSVNGLLFLSNLIGWPHNHFICNPITRDNIKLPCPPKYPSPSSKRELLVDTYGFGVSKKSGQYKVVRLFHECTPTRDSNRFVKIVNNETKCEVYTLGTGSWRSIEPNVPLRYDCEYNTAATFLNGNLHWRGHFFNDSSMWISCFDLETEVFTIFSAPPIHGRHSAISALEECLVFCDNSYDDERKEIVIWFMNEYGDDKSWIKKFIITRSWFRRDNVFGVLRPIKVFEDGDILFSGWYCGRLLCYSNKTKAIEESDLAKLYGYVYDRIGAVSYIPSFLLLSTLTMENVMHF